jgi:hypothetical protein
MEPEGPLPNSQEPTTCHYPEPYQSSPCLHPTSRRSILILSSHLHLGLPSGFRLYQRISPGLRPCEMFRNMLIF